MPDIPPSPVWSLASGMDHSSQQAPEVLTWDERRQWKAYAAEDLNMLSMSDGGYNSDDGKRSNGESEGANSY